MPTQHVDPSSEEHLQDVANALLKSRKVVVITGAGISTNSGIPDFRSENGLYSLIQAQFDAAARQRFQQQSTPSQTESDAEDRSSPEADRASKRRRLSQHDSIEVHAEGDGQEDKSDDDTKAIEPRADSITVCRSPEPASSADTTLEELPPPGPTVSKEDTIICTPQPVRTAIHVSIPTASSPLSSPPLEEFLIPPSTLRNASPPSTLPNTRRQTRSRISELSLPLSSSPLSSPPSLLYDPFRATSLPPSSPSRRSSTSHSEEDETLAARLFSSSQGSTSARNSLPNMKGRDLFDANIWSDPLRTAVFYTFTTSLRQKIRACEPTPSHRFISHLKDRGKLVRCYTQNIDQIEEKVGLSTSLLEGPGSKGRFSRRLTANNNQLSKMVEEARDTRKSTPEPIGNDLSQPQSEDGIQTPVESETPSELPKPPKLEPSRSSGVECVFLHGSLECLRCFRCGLITSWDDGRESETMSGLQPECPHCIGATVAREERGKRALGVGKLRPDIVLYGEEHPNAHLIGPIITHDIALCPDLLLILGTSLRVHGLKVMVREFANTIHNRGGKVVFVNFTKPPESSWGDFIDYWVQWDCDAWVDDLQTRVPKLWDIPQPQKEKPPAKNPVALRDSKANGAWCVLKIMDELGRITGSPMLKRSASDTELRKSVKGSKKGESASPVEKSIQVQTSESETPCTPETPTREAITVNEEAKITTMTETCVVEALVEIIEENPAAEKPTLAKKATKPKRSRKSAPGALERAKKKPPSTLNPNHGRASKATPHKTQAAEAADTTAANAPPVDTPRATAELMDTTTTTTRPESTGTTATLTKPAGAKATVTQAQSLNSPVSTTERMETTPPARMPDTPSTSTTTELASSSPPRGLFSTVLNGVASMGSIFYSVKKNHRVRKKKRMFGEIDGPNLSSNKRRRTEGSGTHKGLERPVEAQKEEEPQKNEEPQQMEDPELKLPPLTNMEPPTPPQLDLRPKAIEPLSPPPAPPNHHHFTPRSQFEPPSRPLDFSSPMLEPPSSVMSRPRFETVPPTLAYSSPTPAPPVPPIPPAHAAAFTSAPQPAPAAPTPDHFGPPLLARDEFMPVQRHATEPPVFERAHDQAMLPTPQLIISQPMAIEYSNHPAVSSPQFMATPQQPQMQTNLEREIDLGRRRAEEHQAEMDAQLPWEPRSVTASSATRTAAERDAAWAMVHLLNFGPIKKHFFGQSG